VSRAVRNALANTPLLTQISCVCSLIDKNVIDRALKKSIDMSRK
jgi:hypothetical protein